ncbi:MAG: lipopolysaccharide biosynthesis protein [Acidimicrobiia bacterium]
MSRDNSIRRRENVGTALIVVATAFSAISVLVFQALGSRTLGTDGFAPIAVLWTLMFLIYTVLQLPAEQHLTRALVVTRDPGRIRRIARDMVGAFVVGTTIGILFVVFTLDRFFEGDVRFVLITAVIMVSRSVMATGRGTLAGHRRFGGYGGTIALEALGLLVGGLVAASLGADAVGFAVVMALAPLATLLARPFAPIEGAGESSPAAAQPGSFLAWLILATAASQLIIAGGPIAVGFIGGTPAAVSIFFTTFALLRGPVTSAYNLVARVLPDFTALAQSDTPERLWRWAPRITIGAVVLAAFGAIGAALLLRTLIELVYGQDFVPPLLAAGLGGAGVGLGLGALFATQVYSASAKGAVLASGWGIALLAAIATLALSDLAPVERVALAFVVGEGTGLALLGLVFPYFILRTGHRVTKAAT